MSGDYRDTGVAETKDFQRQLVANRTDRSVPIVERNKREASRSARRVGGPVEELLQPAKHSLDLGELERLPARLTRRRRVSSVAIPR